MSGRVKHRKSISLAPQSYVLLRRLSAATGETMAALVQSLIGEAAERQGVLKPTLPEAKVLARKLPRIVSQYHVF